MPVTVGEIKRPFIDLVPAVTPEIGSFSERPQCALQLFQVQQQYRSGFVFEASLESPRPPNVHLYINYRGVNISPMQASDCSRNYRPDLDVELNKLG